MKPVDCKHRLWMHDKGAWGCYRPGGHPTIIDHCTEQDDNADRCSNACPEERNERHNANKYNPYQEK